MALWQQNVRRLLAYSSVAHAGYLMIGLCVWAAVRTRDGAANPGGQPAELAVGAVSATLFYLAGYAAATMGAFAAVSYLGRGKPIDRVSDLHGAARRYPGGAAALSLFMLSLTGLPPLVGFWGKLMLIVRALAVDGGPPGMEHLRPWFLALAIITVLNAAISAAYYFRIVAAMYFRPAPDQAEAPPAGGAALAMGLSAVIVLALGMYPAPLIHYSDAAARSAVTPLTAPIPSAGHAALQQDDR
jgi:NADH-quinone oxidoreductase subunit N